MTERLAHPVRRVIVARLRSEFRLAWAGIHGAPHWGRVRVNGLSLARCNGARMDVVEWFALLHDSQRRHDGIDRHHGARAAAFIRSINDAYLRLEPEGCDMLEYACRHHSEGLTEAHVTVQTCWDADRLDLGRVGFTPNPRRLCTPEARDPQAIRAAYARSIGRPIGAQTPQTR
jgi:uncharacterized protein